jgi:hypothetical protein
MLGDILPLRGHVGVELERLEMNFRAHLAIKIFQRLLERLQADDAPRAGDIGDEIDLDGNRCGCRHRESSVRVTGSTANMWTAGSAINPAAGIL